MLLALVMMLLITELLGNSPWEEAEGRGGREKQSEQGMERSLTLLAALSGPERRAQPAGKAVGMLGWMGEAMAQVLRKVGERGCASHLPATAVQEAALERGAPAGGS